MISFSYQFTGSHSIFICNKKAHISTPFNPLNNQIQRYLLFILMLTCYFLVNEKIIYLINAIMAKDAQTESFLICVVLSVMDLSGAYCNQDRDRSCIIFWY